MSWNQEKYLRMKNICQGDIANGRKTAQYYMMQYKKFIIEEDYEYAKAITEVLKPLNFDTSVTHIDIKELR